MTVYLTKVTCRTANDEIAERQVLLHSSVEHPHNLIATALGRRSEKLLSIGGLKELDEKDPSNPVSALTRDTRVINRFRPVLVREPEDEKPLNAGKDISKLSDYPPEREVVLVLNAPEQHQLYTACRERGAKLIEIVTYKGAKAPCTVGAVFESVAAMDQAIPLKMADKQCVYLGNCPKDFVEPISQPIVELCVAGFMSLSNPFDSIQLMRDAENAVPQGVKNPGLSAILLTRTLTGLKQGSALDAMFSNLHSYRGDTHIYTQFDRAVDLCTATALSELYIAGTGATFEMTRRMRLQAGGINSSAYASYEHFRDAVDDYAFPASHLFVRGTKYGFLYENIIRIVRAICLATEARLARSALLRLNQILDSEQLNPDEKARQFEIEAIEQVVRVLCT